MLAYVYINLSTLVKWGEIPFQSDCVKIFVYYYLGRSTVPAHFKAYQIGRSEHLVQKQPCCLISPLTSVIEGFHSVFGIYIKYFV